MANYLDIIDFDGIKTNADLEDLDSKIAQAIENFRIVDGKLVKTYAGGTPSTLPAFALGIVNHATTGVNDDYVVYGIYTFISDKVKNPLNDAGDGFKYVIVLISTSKSKVRIFWWDEERPTLSQLIQCFPITETAMAVDFNVVHNFDDAGDSSGGHYALIQDVKAPNGTSLYFTDGSTPIGSYDIPEETGTTKNLHMNISQVPSLYGSPWYGQLSTDVYAGFTNHNYLGGKDGSAMLDNSNTLTTDSDSTGYDLLADISGYQSAGFSKYDKIVDFHYYRTLQNSSADGGIMVRGIGSNTSAFTQLDGTYYNSLRNSGSVGHPLMIGWGDAVYIAYGWKLYKYTLPSSDGIHLSETKIYPTDNSTLDSDYNIQALCVRDGVNYLYIGHNDGRISRVDTSGNVTDNANLGCQNVKSIKIQKRGTTTYRMWMSDNAQLLRYWDFDASVTTTFSQQSSISVSTSNLPWTAADDLKKIETFNAGLSGSNSYESLIFCWRDKSNPSTFVTKYSATIHHSGASAPVWTNHWSNIQSVFSSLPTNGNESVGDAKCLIMKRLGADPLGNDNLYFVYSKYSNTIGSSDYNSSRLYKVKETGNGGILFTDGALGLIKGHEISYLHDITTSDDVFRFSTGYIVQFYLDFLSATNSSSQKSFHIKDIGWKSSLSSAWSSNGTCEYRYVDLSSKVGLPNVYHKKARNPIIPSGDSFRVFPGNVGQITYSGITNEAKGVWVGYIDRSLFGGKIVHSPDFYGYENRIVNPFSVKDAETKQIFEDSDPESVHPSDRIRYTATAIYDGVQESELPTGLTDVLQLSSAASPKTSKSEIQVNITFDTQTLNKRITGLKLYRSYPSTTGVYEPYKLVKSYNFVDTSIDADYDADSKLFFVGRQYDQKYALIYDEAGTIASWFDSMNGSSYDNGQFTKTTTTGSEAETFTDGGGVSDTKFALKVGGNWKRKISTIKRLRHYKIAGGSSNSVTLTTDIASDTTSVVVNNSNQLVVNDYYLLGYRGVHRDDKEFNDEWNDVPGGSWSSSESYYQNYEYIKVTAINTSTNTITIARGQNVNSYNSTAQSFSAGHPLKLNPATQGHEMSKWYQFKVTKDFNGSFFDSSWKIYRERVGPGWHDADPTGSSKAFAGEKTMYVIPRVDRDSDDGGDFSSWRFTDNTINGSQIISRQTYLNKLDTQLPILESESGSDENVVELKIKEAYVCPTFEQDGIIPVLNNKKFDDPDSDNTHVAIGEFEVYNSISFEHNSTGVSTIRILDDGLISLEEHQFESEDNITINAQYGKILKGRLFLGNIVLDPGDENEDHSDWLAYSELNQFDVRPVSNIIPFEDREGGPITGLSEMFGRLVVFKPQAIFVLDITDPSSPTSWIRKESKINIGNIASEGLVEVHDTIFIIHNDGIYSVTANMIASATATPSQLEKITEDIDDIFLKIDAKGSIRGIYDQEKNEVLYEWTRSSSREIWAYNIYNKKWREVNMSENADLWTYNENSNPMAYDKTSNKILKFDVKKAVGTLWKSKRFRLDYDRKRLIRYATIRHTSSENLTFNIYLDGSNSASFTHTITNTGTSAVSKFPVKRYLKNFEVELVSPSSLNNVEIEQLTFEME